jgi:hypothetical protein
MASLAEDVSELLDRTSDEAKPSSSQGRPGMSLRGLLRLKAQVDHSLEHPECNLSWEAN